MKYILILVLGLFSFFELKAQVVDWVLPISGETDVETDRMIETDSQGNVIVTGTFIGSIQIGDMILNSYNPFRKAIYITKIHRDGNVLWAKTGGDNTDCVVTFLSRDSEDNIIFSINSGGFTYESNEITGGPFILKVDKEGKFIWHISRWVGNASGDYSYPLINLDNEDNLIVASDPWFLPLALQKFDKNGILIAENRFSQPQALDIFLHNCTVDSDGNVYLAVSFNAELRINDTIIYGRDNIAIIKFNNNLQYIWVRNIGDLAKQNVIGCEYFDDGLIWITGAYEIQNGKDSLDFGGKSLGRNPEGNRFIATFTPNGNINFVAPLVGGQGYSWAQMFKEGDKVYYLNYNDFISFEKENNKIVAFVEIRDIVSYNHSICGDRYITGTFQENKTFSSGQIITSAGGKDVFFCEINKI